MRTPLRAPETGELRHTALQHRMDAMTSPVMGTVTRREFLMKAGAAALWVALPWKAAAQNAYPTRPVTIIVPFTPATGADVLARLLAPPLDARLKQPFVVENRAGASGAIGMEAVAKAKPD